MTLHFFVPGLPAPQGSKRYLGKGITVESSKRVAPWRADVRAAAETALNGDHQALWDNPLAVQLAFFLPRPKSHYGTGRNSDRLKDSAPLYPAVTPDADKLARAVLDGITGVVFADDKTVVDLKVRKLYAESTRPGVSVVVDVML